MRLLATPLNALDGAGADPHSITQLLIAPVADILARLTPKPAPRQAKGVVFDKRRRNSARGLRRGGAGAK